jgi:hypothetical protein
VKIAVCYTAVTNGLRTTDYLCRFVATWMDFPPGVDCDLFVCCNGGPLSTEQALVLHSLNVRLFARPNDAGQDITGYMDAAAGPCSAYDAVLFLGESVFFQRAGWLQRLREAWERHGPGLYGPFSSNNVRAHLQTTAIFCSPMSLRAYPVRPLSRPARMEFEHGESALWRRLARRGLPVRLVTFDGEWPPSLWRLPMNIIGRGDQSNLLMMNNHADAWAGASALTRHQWSIRYDSPFQ